MTPAREPAKKAAPKRKAAPRKRAGSATGRFTYEKLRALALSLDLPEVADAVSWGQPTMKAHGKLWFFWNPTHDAPVFKVRFEERDHLIEMDPETYFTTDHHRNWELVLVRPERLDPEWARANLLRVWREHAPKRLLKSYDVGRSGMA